MVKYPGEYIDGHLIKLKRKSIRLIRRRANSKREKERERERERET